MVTRTYCWRRTNNNQYPHPRSGEGEASNVLDVFKDVDFRYWPESRFEVWPKACPDDKMKVCAVINSPKGFAVWDSRGQLYP